MYFPLDIWYKIKTYYIPIPNREYWESHRKLSQMYSPDIDNNVYTYNFVGNSYQILNMTPIVDPDRPYFWASSIILPIGPVDPVDPVTENTGLEPIYYNFSTNIPLQYIEYILVRNGNNIHSSTPKSLYETMYYMYDIPKKNPNGNTILPIYISKRGVSPKKKIMIKLLLSQDIPVNTEWDFEQTLEYVESPPQEPPYYYEKCLHPISFYLEGNISHFIVESNMNVYELMLDCKHKLVLFKEKQIGKYAIYPICRNLGDIGSIINFDKTKSYKLLTFLFKKEIYCVKMIKQLENQYSI